MQCLIVGTDHLGAAPKILKEHFGVDEFIHWDGRKQFRCSLQNIDLIVVYAGFINHSAMWQIKKMAKKLGKKVIYVNRGLSELQKYKEKVVI